MKFQLFQAEHKFVTLVLFEPYSLNLRQIMSRRKAKESVQKKNTTAYFDILSHMLSPTSMNARQAIHGADIATITPNRPIHDKILAMDCPQGIDMSFCPQKNLAQSSTPVVAPKTVTVIPIYLNDFQLKEFAVSNFSQIYFAFSVIDSISSVVKLLQRVEIP